MTMLQRDDSFIGAPEFRLVLKYDLFRQLIGILMDKI
jgi:hypothetical protein